MIKCGWVFKFVPPSGLRSKVIRLRWLTPPAVLVSPSGLTVMIPLLHKSP